MARSSDDQTAALAQDHYAANHRGFHWAVPSRMNMAQWCCARWAQRSDAQQRIAVIADGPDRAPTRHSFAQLQDQANRLSRVLALRGVRRGDRVAIVLPQRFETAVAYMAVLQMGAIAMPLSQLFGPEALLFRLQDSGAVAAVVDESTSAALLGVRGDCPNLRCVAGVDAPGADVDWVSALARVKPKAVMADTAASDPAVLIYTSGTTGNPKGGLIPHSALFGNLTGFLCSQNWLGYDPNGLGVDDSGFPPAPLVDTVFWSPADWAWTGGLMDALLPMLFFGQPIVAYNGRFAPETAFELLQRHRVTHTFLFPTALKAMMKAVPEPRARYDFTLHACMSAGEAVGDAVFNWCREALGVVVNEMFGQTEINYIVGNCAINDQRGGGVGWPAKPGSMGKGYPGHRVAVIDDEANECPPGQAGEVAVHRLDVHGVPDPVFFLGYWHNDEATRNKYSGDWCRTGDMAVADEDGYLWYQGRADDMFKAAGYRIGPSEIENCLVKHPAVANAAVVPKPDAQRGAVVKAYVVLTPEFAHVMGDAALSEPVIADLQAHVRARLAPYEYPKEIEFIDALPMTTTGKVQRRVLRLQEEARAVAQGTP